MNELCIEPKTAALGPLLDSPRGVSDVILGHNVGAREHGIGLVARNCPRRLLRHPRRIMLRTLEQARDAGCLGQILPRAAEALDYLAVFAGKEKIFRLFSPAQFRQKQSAFFGENYHPALVALRFPRVERYGVVEQIHLRASLMPDSTMRIMPCFGRAAEGGLYPR